ncbi:MAG TPA: hypothetical protein VFQ36_21070 [Ktedonobacteraceae bacterium]|nr:hypothetical protein [Ktedonobacteraceae bacterium]
MDREFGDFQTPQLLVDAVLKCLRSSGKEWSRVIEPTCGRGNFIEGLLKQALPPDEIQGIEIQDAHANLACKVTKQSVKTRVVIQRANLFDLHLQRNIHWSGNGSLLVLGNPPWITNAELGSLESTNLPAKTNVKGLQGLEARLGKSNFDIAEYIWLKLIRELVSEQPTIALLCKTSVARNVLQFAFEASLPIRNASIRKIDAKKWFGAAVDACLFCVEVGSGEPYYAATLYDDLFTDEPVSIMGMVGKQLVGDMLAYQQVAPIDGISPVTWRQGLKHDAASVMELSYDTHGNLHNKSGEIVVVEPDYIYPLLKSSDLFNKVNMHPHRAIIVPQTRPGENTLALQQTAPRLWSYLTAHMDIFSQRKSSIYQGQPPFTIFGIGEYSFAPYKVGISGLHKTPRFRAIGPIDGLPVMLDDTCYFIACNSAEQAAFLTALLNDPLCLELIQSIAFLDAKRPITKKLLQRIDLRVLYHKVDRHAHLLRFKSELERLGFERDLQEREADSIERFLDEYSPESRRRKPPYTMDALFPDSMDILHSTAL